jgi:hypothetical protein
MMDQASHWVKNNKTIQGAKNWASHQVSNHPYRTAAVGLGGLYVGKKMLSGGGQRSQYEQQQ